MVAAVVRLSRFFPFALLLLALPRADAWAEASELASLPLEELLKVQVQVSSVSGSDLLSTPSTTTILDEQFLKAYSFLSVQEALRVLPGVLIERSTGKNQMPTIRGILQSYYVNKVLIMINGIAAWDAVTGDSPTLNRVSINDVERIEILKGPASVIYGTNAYSGAINIVLKQPKTRTESGGSLVVGAGDKSAYTAGANYLYSKDDLSFFISGNSYSEQGDQRSVTLSDQTTGYYYDYVNPKNFNLNARYKQHSLLFNLYEENQQKAVAALSSGIDTPLMLKGYLLNYTFEDRLAENFLLKAGAIFDYNERSFLNNDVGSINLESPNIATQITGWRSRVFSDASWDFAEHWNLEFGANAELRKSVEYNRYSPVTQVVSWNTDLEDQRQRMYGVFSNLGFQMDPFNVIVGSRYTYSRQFQSTITSRGTLIYSLSPRSSLKLIAGQSYRAPSLFEVYYAGVPPSTTQGGTFGNRFLQPEKSTSYEADYLLALRNVFFQGSLYYAQYTGEIVRVFPSTLVRPDNGAVQTQGPSTLTTYGNSAPFQAWGLELESRYQATDWSAFANYDLIVGNSGDATPGSNGEPTYNFKYVPVNTAAAGISEKWGSFGSSAVLRGLESTGGSSGRVHGAVLLDLNLSYHQKVREGSYLIHTISIRDATNTETVTAEQVEQSAPSIPWEPLERVIYTLSYSF